VHTQSVARTVTGFNAHIEGIRPKFTIRTKILINDSGPTHPSLR